MSPHRILAPFVALLCAAACNPTVEFDVEISDDTVIERGTLLEQLASSFGFGALVSLDLESTQEFENNDVRREQVREARLTQLTLTVTAPTDADLEFLDSLSFSVDAPDLDKERVAEKDPVPADSATVDLDLADLDLGPYIRSSEVSMTSEVEGRRPSEDTTIQVDLVFHVIADVIGPATTG